LVGPAALVIAVVAAPTARADTAPAFINGDGSASASFFDLRIHLGDLNASGLALGFGSGRALTNYQDGAASAQGEALDYSLLSSINQQPTAACPDYIPLFLASTAPQLTRADSSDPNGAASQLTTIKYAGFPTYGPVFGTQDAMAGPTTTATAAANAPSVDSGVVAMVNAASTSTSAVVGTTRTATATMTADSLSIMGGALTLFKPTWTAVAKSGSTTEADATFTYSSAMFLGISRPGNTPGDLQLFKGWMESTFSALGMIVDLPTVTVTPGENGTGTVAISPLTIGMQHLPLGQQFLGPLLNSISPQLDAALKNYLASPCSNQSLELLVPVLEGFASGTGSLGFAVGGATAMTDDVYYPPVSLDSGVADASLSVPVDAPPTTSLPAFAAPSDFSVPTTPTDSTDVTAPTVDDTTTVPTTVPDHQEVADPAAPRVARLAPAADRSLPGHSGGKAGWLTLVALAAVVALAGADQFVMRRSRRKFSA
jgi:hypothetical protein